MCTRFIRSILLILGLSLASMPACATIIQTLSGVSSVGNPVSFKAELTIAGDILTVQLFNLSPQSSAAPNDLLSSYFFDIINGSSRPSLNYVSAVGDVYLAKKSSADTLQTANANIKAVNNNDNSWAFRGDLNIALIPFLKYGIGTVGNNNFTPNNFNGNIVDGMDYSIYTGDVTTQNLHNKLLVKNMATFTFSGLTGFSEANIASAFSFGMGTAPDSLLTCPEPATLALLGLGGLLLRRRK